MGISDYGNILYFGLANRELNKFQKLQNYVAKTNLVWEVQVRALPGATFFSPKSP